MPTYSRVAYQTIYAPVPHADTTLVGEHIASPRLFPDEANQTQLRWPNLGPGQKEQGPRAAI